MRPGGGAAARMGIGHAVVVTRTVVARHDSPSLSLPTPQYFFFLFSSHTSEEASLFQVLIEEFRDGGFLDRVRYDNQFNIVFFAQVFLDEITIFLVMELVLVLKHEGIVLVVLRPIVLDGQSEFFIVKVQFQGMLGDGVHEKGGTDPLKPFAQSILEKLFAQLLAFAPFALFGSQWDGRLWRRWVQRRGWGATAHPHIKDLSPRGIRGPRVLMPAVKKPQEEQQDEATHKNDRPAVAVPPSL